jgi:hypothetical protein
MVPSSLQLAPRVPTPSTPATVEEGPPVIGTLRIWTLGSVEP